jgi:hypothetical protein
MWSRLHAACLALKQKITSIWVVLSMFVVVFVVGAQSTRVPSIHDFFGLPATWDSALLRDSRIQTELRTLSEVKSILDDIPPDSAESQLIDRLNADPDYREHLTGRLVRLLGIRNESMGSLKPSLIRIIDERFSLLYTHELGARTFRPDKTAEFVECLVQMRSEANSWEQELRRRQEELARQ